jgi:ABC-2 type transport system permease protein
MNEYQTVQRSELQPVVGSWARGFYPIYRKELSYWFGTQRWVSQLFLWLGLGAFSPIAMIMGTPDGGKDRGVAVLTLFLWSGSNAMSIGTILLAQGTIVEEKMKQTLLWIFSKPLSTAGFILAKFAAYAVFIAAIVIAAPSIVAYIAAMIMHLPAQISIFNYLMGVGMLYLVLLFVLALTIMLGVWLDKTAAVTASAIVVFFSGSTLQSNSHLRWLEPYSVWALQHNSHETMVGQFPLTAWIAMGSTIVLIALFLSIAIWRMKRYEF